MTDLLKSTISIERMATDSLGRLDYIDHVLRQYTSGLITESEAVKLLRGW